MATRNTILVSPNGENFIQVLHTLYSSDVQFHEDLDLAMRSALGNDFAELIFSPAADQRVHLALQWKSMKRDQSSADLSDGIMRFLNLLTILATPNPPFLIAIDHPETGLHPPMLPIIAEYARNASIRTLVIFTTHSAELLDAFSEFAPTITVVKRVDGQSQVSVLSSEFLQYWLEDDSLGNLYRSGGLEDSV